MSDQKPAAVWHPHASREEALAAEVRDLRDQRDALVAELARARGCTENVIRCAHGIGPTADSARAWFETPQGEGADALRYIRRVLGMQPSVRAQLALREQEVAILTARLDAVLTECDAHLLAGPWECACGRAHLYDGDHYLRMQTWTLHVLDAIRRAAT